MKLENCNASDFIERISGKKVICFGAGSTLIEADYEVLKIDRLEEYISFFVDNDVQKQGLQFHYREKTFDIDSPKVLKDRAYIQNKVILITCASYVEVYEQLNAFTELDQIPCYFYNCICSYPDLDVNNFFHNEINKAPYKNYRSILESLELKDKHKGEKCFIIGNGPSLNVGDLEKLKGCVTFAANRIFKIFSQVEWRPTYYFCTDYLMYGLDHQEINQIDAKLRFVPRERALAAGVIYDKITYYNRIVNCINIVNNQIVRSKKFEFSAEITDWVFGGQTVLYDAMQMAVYMGFSEIYLLGCDHNYSVEVKEDGTIISHQGVVNHFDASYDKGLEEAIAVVAPLYAVDAAYHQFKQVCQQKGILVKNATRGGKLEVFERICFDEIDL